MRKLPILIVCGLIGAAGSAFAQTPNTGGMAGNHPSTVGVDPRPDNETMRAQRPGQRAIAPMRSRHSMKMRGHRHSMHKHRKMRESAM